MPTESAATKELREKLQVKPPAELVEWINLLVYGEAGAGKTHLMGTAADDPRTSPVLAIDVEGGFTTIRHRSDIDTVAVRTMKELTNVFNELANSANAKSMPYKTVAIDSITELADLDMRNIMQDAFRANPDRVDVDVPSPREWGKTRNHMRSIIRAFRDLPCHVIYTAGLGTTSEEGMATKYHPGFGGKLKQEIPGFMDIVGYLKSEVDAVAGEKHRVIQFLGSGRVVAKDRTNALGDMLTDTTIPLMWDLINGS
jgi:hypothetical protein